MPPPPRKCVKMGKSGYWGLGALPNTVTIPVNGYHNLKDPKMYIFLLFLSTFFCYGSQNVEKGISTSSAGFAKSPTMTKYTRALYGVQANKRYEPSGKIDERPGMRLVMTGWKALAWKINVEKAGEYLVSVNYSVDQDNTPIEVKSGDRIISDLLPTPNGYMGSRSNYERHLLKGTLPLKKGENEITFVLNQPEPGATLHFRALELNAAFDKENIQAEEKRAHEARANMEWMRKSGYGLMFHWTSQSSPLKGPQKSYAQAVRDFNVTAFADMVEKTGAAWIFITVGHAESYCPAPVKAWERLHPGKTTKRDLLMELAEALNDRGIKLMFYLNSPLMAHMKEATTAEYMENHRNLLSEFGNRYGDKLAGYWFDSWYQGYQTFPEFDFEELMTLCRIGFSNRPYCLNSWVYPAVTPWQEYWAGEVGSPIVPADEPLMNRGAGKGLPYHALLMLEGGWVYGRKNPNATGIPAPRTSGEKLGSYIKECMNHGGVVTVNLMISQEGKISDKTVAVMEKVRRIVRGK